MKDILSNLLSLPEETEVVEFKEAKNQFNKEKLGEYFSALSNEANLLGKNQAWLVFGVNNSKQVVGTNITEKQLNEYKEEVATHSSPKLSFIEVHKIQWDSGETVLLLEIPPAPRGMPVAWKGHFFGRNGESLAALNINELEKIRSQANAVDWSAQIIPGANIYDLSKEAIEKAKEQFAIKNPALKAEMQKWDDAVFLNKAKITIQGKITNTAILLLGKPESDHFLNPATSKITWILKDRDNVEKDYQHFSCPLILNVDNIYSKIRNLKYRYMQEGSLFPEEVDQYHPYIIREALNNCIVHQDYSFGGKINIVEKEDGVLTFSNMGAFIPVTVENVINSDAPESKYRNPFLANAMVGLNMIDTIGSGIKKMFFIQRDKYFPLPDYDTSNNKVQVKIIGKVIDINYARKIAQIPALSLNDIIMLDKVSKQKELTPEEVAVLKSRNLIEGRKPNFYISSKVAAHTNQREKYIKLKGIDNDYIQKIILDCIEKFGDIKRTELENVLFPKLSETLDISQKRNKVKNALQKLKNEGRIVVDGKSWKMSKTDK